MVATETMVSTYKGRREVRLPCEEQNGSRAKFRQDRPRGGKRWKLAMGEGLTDVQEVVVQVDIWPGLELWL